MTRTLRAFTIVELMVTLALASIVLAIGIPSMRSFTMSNRMASQANELVGDLMLARSEAVKRSTPVVVCARDNAACRAAADGNWDQGWLTYVDEDRDGAYDPDDGDGVLEAGEDDLLVFRTELRGGQTLRDPDGAAGTFDEAVAFTENGALAVPGGTLILCDARGDPEARGIVLGASGRAEVLREQPDGSDWPCP